VEIDDKDTVLQAWKSEEYLSDLLAERYEG